MIGRGLEVRLVGLEIPLFVSRTQHHRLHFRWMSNNSDEEEIVITFASP
jgi:hypothetical protein